MLEKKLIMIPDVVESGLFVKLANIAYLGKRSTVETMKKKGNIRFIAVLADDVSILA